MTGTVAMGGGSALVSDSGGTSGTGALSGARSIRGFAAVGLPLPDAGEPGRAM